MKLRALSNKEYPALSALVKYLDNYLAKQYPDFFSADVCHPALPVKPFKVVHDNLWGTNRFGWAELALIDSPIVQRLRDIHQVGLASHVYPSAHHTRFEHCLGVVTLASRVFEALLTRNAGEIKTIAEVIAPGCEISQTIAEMRQELRLAALLHDTGHSLFSHTSERVFQSLEILRKGSAELKRITGKEKGAGEVISFCLAQTQSVSRLLARAQAHLIIRPSQGYTGDIDLQNVALLIIGRAKHPCLQFLGDIISSGFDADKLDYLVRDADAAGLPLRYDLDRYLYEVRLERDFLADDEGDLERLYTWASPTPVERRPKGRSCPFPHFETNRLRLPKAAMNTIEQIVICKMMLFSYLYHHSKVRAAEGTLERMLRRIVASWGKAGEDDLAILGRFLEMTDSALRWPQFTKSDDPYVRNYSYRLLNRLIPRETYGLGGDVATHEDRPLLTDFLTNLQDKSKSGELVRNLEHVIGKELIKLDASLGPTPEDALCKAGVWVDVPKAPKFEDVDELVKGDVINSPGVPIMQIFPVSQWTQAYTHFRYSVRIFSFSEYWDITKKAARTAMEEIIKIHDDSFYLKVGRTRQ